VETFVLPIKSGLDARRSPVGLKIAPGPNNPVGETWIALSIPTYGIHGAPNPAAIGKRQSHGCVRLTNWDAVELGRAVKMGATVDFIGTENAS